MKTRLILISIFLAIPALALPQKVVVVVFENTSYDEALGQPFFSQFAKTGTLLANYHAVAHPSEPNYIDMIAGSPLGVTGDGQYDLPDSNLADLLEAKGRSWHVYAEQYPGNCFQGMHKGSYYRKHNPFISFTNIQNNPARCSNISGSDSFISDFQSGKLANYTMYVPDINNDGHNTGPNYADQWFSKTFGPLIQNSAAMADVLVVATFDEDDGFTGNRIYTALYGPSVTSGSQVSARYDHNSLLKTVEDIFQLNTLGRNDAKADSFAGLLK